MSSRDTTLQPEGMVTAHIDVFPEDGQIIARWSNLRLSAHGTTRDEAVSNLIQMVIAVFVMSLQRNDLDEMLRKAGIQIQSMLPGVEPPKRIERLPYLVVETDAGSRAVA